MRMTKRFLALFLAFLMAFGSVPSAVLAAGEEEAAPAATSEPAPEAVSEPAPEPTAEPVPEPTAEPTPEPTAVPTAEPTAVPTAVPTEAPVEQPEQAPVVPQAPAEQEQPGVEEPMNENKDEYSSAPQAGGQSAEQSPEAGPGFQLPGIVVDGSEAETEIVRPETQTGEDMNAENGIMPILSLPEADAKFNDGWTSYQYEDGRGTRSIRLNYNNGIVVIPGASALTNLKYKHANSDGNYDVNKRWFSLHIVIDGAEKTYKVGGQFDTYTETNCIVNIHNQDDAQIDYILNSFRVDGKNGSISNSGTGNGYNNHGEIGSLDMKSTGSNVYIDLTTVKRDYTLTYVANGDGVEGLPKEGMVRDLQDPYKTHTFTLDVKPTRPGYAFKGWSMSSDSTEIVGQVTADYNRPNVTVYAVWEKSAPTAPTAQELADAKSVQVQLKCGTEKSDGSAYHDPDNKTVEVVNADNIEVSEVAEENGVYSVTVTLRNVEGYVNGFAANEHYYNSEASYSTKLTYNAETTRWTGNAISIDLTCKLHSVTYIVEGKEYEKFEDLAEDEEPETPADPTRDGYVFASWDKSVNTVKGDITYTAQWTPDFKGAVSLDDWTYGDEHLPSVKSSLAGPSGVTVTGPELTYTKRGGAKIDPARTLKNGRPIDAGEYTVTATWKYNGEPVEKATDDFKIKPKAIGSFSCVKALRVKKDESKKVNFTGEDCMDYGYDSIAHDLVYGDKFDLGVTVLDVKTDGAPMDNGKGSGWGYQLFITYDRTADKWEISPWRTDYARFEYLLTTPVSIKDVNGKDVSKNYDFGDNAGTLVVAPYDAWVQDSEWTYGDEINVSDIIHERIPLFLYNYSDIESTITYYTTNDDGTRDELLSETPKNVGRYWVEVSWKVNNYVEEFIEHAYLTILPKNVTVTAENKTVTYGDALPELTATVEDMVPGESAEGLIKYELGCEYEAGDPVDTYDITVSGNEYQGNYHVKFVGGTLTVKPKDVTIIIKGKTDTVEYNGSEQHVEGYGDPVFDGLVEGDTIDVTLKDGKKAVASGTTVNTYPMGLNKDSFEAGGDAIGNYNVKWDVTDGWLKITDRAVKYAIEVQPKGETATYDGQRHDVSGFESLTFTVEGNAYTVEGLTASASGTDADTYPVRVTGVPIVKDAKGNDVTAQFTVTAKDASLTITKKTVQLKSAGLNKEYDGAELTNGEKYAMDGTAEQTGITFTSGSEFVPGEGLTYHFTGSQTNRGSSSNSFTYAPMDGTKLGNYEITPAYGTLTVDPRKVTVTANDQSKVYGAADPALTVTVEGTVNGDTVAYEVDRAPGEDVGPYGITVTGEKDQGNYEVDFVNGTLTINQRAATVSWQRTIRANGQPIYLNVLHIAAEGESATLTGALDGHALQSVSGVVNIVDGMPGEHTGREQGVDITGAVIEDADGNDVTSNYDITYTGTLTITAQDILVDPLPDVMYDGQNHEPAVRVRDAENRNLLRAGTDYEVKYSDDTKNVGTVTVTVTGLGYYDEAEAEVQFEITRRPVALTAADDEWTYDAQWHSNTTIIASDVDGVGGFVDGEGVEADHDKFASIRDAGKVANVLSDENGRRYHPIEGTDLDNYAITETNGTLTVNPLTLSESDLTVNEPRDVYYNGQAHPWTPNVWLNDIGDGTGTSRRLVNGQDYTVTYDRDELISAGRVVATVSFKEDGNYTGSASYDYTIMQRPLYLQSGSNEWLYTGALFSEQTVTDVSANMAKDPNNSGYVPGEELTYSNFKSVRHVRESGKENNGFEVSDSDTALVSNYDVTLINGDLAVRPQSINEQTGEEDYIDVVVESLPENAVFDGTEHKWEPAVKHSTGSQASLRKDENYTVEYFRENADGELEQTEDITSAGEIVVHITGINDYKDTLEIRYTIASAAFEASAPTDFLYDGTAHQWTPTVTGVDGAALTAGTDYTVTYNTADFTDAGAITATITGIGNYAGTETRSYQITQRHVTLTSGDATGVYNGAALTNGTVTVGGDNFAAGEGASYDVTGSQTNVGDSPNAFTYALNDNTNEDNYRIDAPEFGTLTVTARPVTVSTESATQVYDGTALTAPGSIVGLAPGETAAVNTVSITDADSVRNAYTIAWGSTDSRNYTVTNGTIGTLTVTARPVTVNTESAAQVYDGTALTAAGSIEGLAPGETATVNTTSITDAATVDNDYTIAWGTADSRNYAVSDGDIGTLTVTARTVTMTSGSATRAYNGAALTNGAVTVGGQGFVGGQGAAYTVTGSQTAVGTSANAFTYRLTGGAQARNYNITTTAGTLTVTPAPAGSMAVNTPTNFLYDGAAHQWTPTVTGIGGAALTAGVDYNVTYSTANFTDAGAITATITGIGNYAGSTVTRTYRINQRLVIMSSGDATRAYNGQPLTNDDVTVTGNGFAAGDGATYNVTGRRTLPGTARNLFTYRLNAGTDADNYTIMQVYGDLTVEPAENTAEIEDNETPLGGQPDDADDADGGDDAEIAEIEDDDTPLAALPVIDDDDDGNGRDGGDNGNGGGYALNEEVSITEDATPLAGGPTQEECCILHFIIMLGALCVAMYYTHDRKKRQEREYELRAEMQQQ